MASGHSRRYGVAHRKRRERVAREVRAGGVLCVRCDLEISPDEEWHLDHNDDGRGWLGPAHAACNTSAGGRVGRQRQLVTTRGEVGRWSRCWCGPSEGRDPRCPADVCKAKAVGASVVA
jgi:hypothetical protein